MVVVVGGSLRGGLVVGLSGVSCGGKTTVSRLLRSTLPWSKIVHQDGYFHPNDPKHHTLIPNLNHFNWELKSALDLPVSY
jgi:nicotinamide/nicotinate riboside kinase